MRRYAILAFATAGIAGCMPGPDYVRPEANTPAAWRIDYAQAAEVANTKWWEQFGNPVLNGLVETACARTSTCALPRRGSISFRRLEATRSQLYPQFGYGADASRVRPAGSASRRCRRVPTLLLAVPGLARRVLAARPVRARAAPVRGVAGAGLRQRAGPARRGASLVASVATSYIALRALDRQLEIAQATAPNFGETARIFDLRFKAGVVAKTEVMQITSQRSRRKRPFQPSNRPSPRRRT